MEIKVDLNDRNIQERIGESLQAQLLAGAVAHIVKELTPDRLKEFVEKALAESLRSLTGYTLQDALRKISEPMIHDYLKTAEVKARIEKATQEGIDKAINDIPENVAAAIKQAVALAISNRFAQNRNY